MEGAREGKGREGRRGKKKGQNPAPVLGPTGTADAAIRRTDLILSGGSCIVLRIGGIGGMELR